MDQIVNDLISNTIPKYLAGDALHETLLSSFECPGWNEYLNGGMTGTVGILVEHDVDASVPGGVDKCQGLDAGAPVRFSYNFMVRKHDGNIRLNPDGECLPYGSQQLRCLVA